MRAVIIQRGAQWFGIKVSGHKSILWTSDRKQAENDCSVLNNIMLHVAKKGSDKCMEYVQQQLVQLRLFTPEPCDRRHIVDIVRDDYDPGIIAVEVCT